ncbi:MAG: glutamate--cysteine ligase [Ferrovum sp. 37-45-19]|uniref:glutamate--cysteine ligase n=1 Tax=Ferrovum sp. JA12 TaxID=1356299 RepID=UPI000703BC64|nr:glutamate--cysteine ligase [Ferrovum sp. JA12]OYV79546.1 MAG: glutamate--cysteine ligase [Ferrovum sp. 21-44-67]OYV94660.1 MAG: glutamate--cysteine ligase [Ferrovum sp. 37-45-19]OZB34519.1 MAG: glutamate--cysteine ligase [Ferrovum sp. 34-44-207]HQT81465.1 glutamate--cysteine ligase [Ferrovaceae bacterium]KRH79434.1 glutamate-cysteine ligase [Ferrovum sp. JA12]
MVPHLSTALTGPLQSLESHILDAMPTIEHWFRQQWLEHPAPLYTSVDLRNSGFKLAPVDTNLFPAGFNNLRPEFYPLCIQALMTAVEKICPDTRQFLLIPENHTRNTFYLENVAVLKTLLQKAGFAVRIGTFLPEIQEPTRFDLPSGEHLILEPIIRSGRRVGLKDYDPCAVILNNDLSAGIPELLKGINQPIVPPLFAGWTTRKKSVHFSAFNQVAQEFSELIKLDPWVINPYFSHAANVDFNSSGSQLSLAEKVDELLDRIKTKYQEYDIKDDPFIIIKADSGTYGMGIMTVKSPDDVVNLNRKQRNKMSVIKEGQVVREVLLQEGVYTFENVEGAVAEPVVYMIDHYVVGGFYRVHTERGIDENLNAPGAKFVPLAFETEAIAPDQTQSFDAPPNRFYTYGVVARLAMLAAARELEQMESVYNSNL